jgi:dCTP deaminase
MILSASTLRKLKPVEPFCERAVFGGKSYGLSVAGYDIRIAHEVLLGPRGFCLAASLEKFCLPNNVLGLVKDKSSWARQGLSLFNTVLEPGWKGFLTLELANLGPSLIPIDAGSPIAQVLFFFTDAPTEGYSGKYQNQGPAPQPALFE